MEINSNLEIMFEKDDLEQYVIEVLTLGFCKSFLPVCFVKSSETLAANYNVSGYRKLSSIKNIAIGDLLNIVIGILHGMFDGEKHLLFSDEYEINDDTVFVDKGYSNIKMIYIPSKEESTGPEKIISFLNIILRKSSKEGEKYIKNIIDKILEVDFTYYGLINQIEEMRQEIYLCGIE